MSDPFHVSTGHLPPPEEVQALVEEAHRRFQAGTEGRCSRVYPALAQADPRLFGICLAETNGRIHAAGDAELRFAIMSVAKPFVFALVCQALGPEEVRERLGVNATGLAFDSIMALELMPGGRTNPMVNAGAMETTALTPGTSPEAQWQFLQDGLSRFAGRPLSLDEPVYASASQSNHRNRGIAWVLHGLGRLKADPTGVVDLYTRQSSLSVSARDLAMMGATLADGGVNPLTRERVVDAETCHHALAVMSSAGNYEGSGDWLYDTGLPGKSGIAGGIVSISPGKGGLGTFAPPLDAAGNSIKGQQVARFLSRRLGLSLFVSAPEGVVPVPG